MSQYKRQRKNGFTTVDVAIAGLILIIAMLSIGQILSESQKGWNLIYNRMYSEVVTGGHIAKRTFDSIVRKSSSKGITIDPDSKWVEVHYYDTDGSSFLDRYAKFFVSGNLLRVERGWLNPNDAANPKGTIATDTICGNVNKCIFKQSGNSVHMMLTLNTGTEKMLIGTSAILHNN